MGSARHQRREKQQAQAWCAGAQAWAAALTSVVLCEEHPGAQAGNRRRRQHRRHLQAGLAQRHFERDQQLDTGGHRQPGRVDAGAQEEGGVEGEGGGGAEAVLDAARRGQGSGAGAQDGPLGRACSGMQRAGRRGAALPTDGLLACDADPPPPPPRLHMHPSALPAPAQPSGGNAGALRTQPPSAPAPGCCARTCTAAAARAPWPAAPSG